MKKIIVLLAAYNGEKYIKEQILSIVNQTLKPSLIIINIDKSNDKTLKIIEDCILNYPIIKILSSNKRFGSPGSNFLYMFQNLDFSNYDFIALSDQDDIWQKDKLKKAIYVLDKGVDGYSSDVEAFWINGKKKSIIKSQNQKSFDYLFESAGPGCTYVLSKNLTIRFQKFVKVNRIKLRTITQYHDWLIYAFARSHNFKWYIDPYISLQYRQHSLNEVGANVGLNAFRKRVYRVLFGDGFEYVIFLVNVFKNNRYQFVKKWYPVTRFGFLRLACSAFDCRRSISGKIYFFFAFLLMAIIFPKKIRNLSKSV